jgi:hypothetical protein
MSALGQVAPPFFFGLVGLREMVAGWRKRMEPMPDRLTSALLAALNESTEIKDSDWLQLERALRDPLDGADRRPDIEPSTGSENRFAATVCSGMAKVRMNS